MRDRLMSRWYCLRLLPASVSGMLKCGCSAALTILRNKLLKSPSFVLIGMGASIPKSWLTCLNNFITALAISNYTKTCKLVNNLDATSCRVCLFKYGEDTEAKLHRKHGYTQSHAPVQAEHHSSRQLLRWGAAISLVNFVQVQGISLKMLDKLSSCKLHYSNNLNLNVKLLIDPKTKQYIYKKLNSGWYIG